jgi:two-component system chemotaxis response regulator CheB
MDDAATKVLIVEDSRATALALARLLTPFNVVGIARTGEEALQMERQYRPDVVTMDIILPDTDGLELTRRILARRHVPIVIVSSVVEQNRQQLVFDALRAGAYDVVPKSRFFNTTEDKSTHKLARLVRAATSRTNWNGPARVYRAPASEHTPNRRGQPELGICRSAVAIGASTGGPPANQRVLAAVPRDFPLPILIAQHMSEGFIDGYARWLDSHVNIDVRIAQEGQMPSPAVAYFAPSGHHLGLSAEGRFALTPCDGRELCPAADWLFDSMVRTFDSRGIFLLLTGMGRDGARGMLAAKQCGALTAVQDEESSVIFGMAREALLLGAADHVMPLDELGPWLVRSGNACQKPTAG